MRQSNGLRFANKTTLLILVSALATGCSWFDDDEENFYEPADLVDVD
jgi:hypothetical protein